jgi:hypothetical protein
MVFTSIDIIPRGIVEQCRTDMDKDNAAPLASLSTLRFCKNTLASIFSLSPEIIVTIFTYFVEEENVKIIIHRSGAPTPIIITRL